MVGRVESSSHLNLREYKIECFIGGDWFKLFSWEATETLQKEMLRVWGKSSAMAFCFAHPPSVVRAIISGDPYPIKSLIICDNNPLITWPNSKLVYKAIKSPNLDLIVTLDLFMTPSAVGGFQNHKVRNHGCMEPGKPMLMWSRVMTLNIAIQLQGHGG